MKGTVVPLCFRLIMLYYQCKASSDKERRRGGKSLYFIPKQGGCDGEFPPNFRATMGNSQASKYQV